MALPGERYTSVCTCSSSYWGVTVQQTQLGMQSWGRYLYGLIYRCKNCRSNYKPLRFSITKPGIPQLMINQESCPQSTGQELELISCESADLERRFTFFSKLCLFTSIKILSPCFPSFFLEKEVKVSQKLLPLQCNLCWLMTSAMLLFEFMGTLICGSESPSTASQGRLAERASVWTGCWMMPDCSGESDRDLKFWDEKESCGGVSGWVTALGKC